MKAKTIKQVLNKKFNDFLESIEDERVKNLVKENTIITGGSIASMLLGEKVNDYDLYFTNRETTLSIAKYYIDKFKENPPAKFKNDDKNIDIYIDSNENERVKIVVKSAGIVSEEEQDDYQYFETINNVNSTEALDYVDDAVEILKEDEVDDKPKYRPVFITSNAITLSHSIQIIVRFFGIPEEIHKNYDFEHCKNYWLSKTGELVLHNSSLQALLTRELVYTGSLYPLCSVIRTRKFLRRGWNINAGQYLKMCFQISELDLSDLEVLEEQLLGVDVEYFLELINALKKQKERDTEFNFGFEYIATIIDKLF